jgi:hypothetical protein
LTLVSGLWSLTYSKKDIFNVRSERP